MAAGRPGHYAADYELSLLFRIWSKCHLKCLVRRAADTLESISVSSCQKKKKRKMFERARTFKVEMGGPVALNMRNHPFSTAVQAWVISDADARAGGVQVVEAGGQRRESSRFRDAVTSSRFLARWNVEGRIGCRGRVRV